jgi:predicted Ser/Thr protein kinase
MNCPRCESPSETQALQEFGGVCPKCLLEFAAEKDAPAFPNLEIVSTLGEGGMGVVYKAVQKQLGRMVALKVLSPQLSTDPSFVERFTREAKALATLSHPNIVGIFDTGVHDGVPYLIMEYVEGTSLRKLLAAKKLTADQALQVVPQICDALAYAHAHGVVHRDVKPENILIDREGRVRIADFGLAKLASPDQTRITRTNMVMGTPSYMAPEQIENPSAVDHRADLYSLGVIFYEMLTGELPLGRFKPPSERASTDRRLDPVVMKSLEKEPDDRYQSAEEVKERVTHLETRREIVVNPRPKRASARSLGLAAAILVLIAIAFALEGQDPSAIIWTGFAAAVCGLIALSRLTPPSKAATTPADSPGVRRLIVRTGPGPLKKAAFILANLGGVGWVGGFVLTLAGLHALGQLIATVGVALLMAALVVALLALILHAFRRATTGSMGWAVTLIVIALLVLGVHLSERKSASAAARTHARQEAARRRMESEPSRLYRLEDGWPGRLPDGLVYERQATGAEALQQAQMPLRLLEDLKQVRYARLQPGGVEILGLQFASQAQQDLWWPAPELGEGTNLWYRKGLTHDCVLLLRRGSHPVNSASVEHVWDLIFENLR